MKKSILSLLCLFFVNLTFAQCFFGFEHISTAQNDSALVIHKYGFPNYTDFELYQDNNNSWIIDTILSNQTSDTLIFGTHVDTLGTFKLYGTSSAGDTLGYAKSGVYPSSCYPEKFVINDYVAPTSISASDGSLVIGQINNGSSLSIPGGVTIQDNGDSIIVSDLTEGFKTAFYVDNSGFDSLYVSFIIGDPSNWANIQNGTMTCPIGINLATDQNTCDGEAYIGQVQNGIPPYSYDWNGNGVFNTDTIDSGLCVGNHEVTIQDVNGDIRTCAFAMGSVNNGYFPPTQPNDTTVHSYINYCIDPNVDSVSVIGSQTIDSTSASVVWSFYENNVLIDQILDTIHFTASNPTFSNVFINAHLICNGDTLKTSSSVFTVGGYFEYPFTEVGFLGLDDNGQVTISPELYPNPASKIVSIKGIDDLERVVIYNSQGKTVKRAQSKELDVSLLKTGSYFVHIFGSENKRYVKKMVIH